MFTKRLKITKEQFTEKENRKLLKLKSKYPEYDWEEISRLMKTKSDRQCKDRYNNYLDPNINKTPFNEDEDKLLIDKYNEIGSKWKKIKGFFPNRSEVQVRNRCQKLLRSKEKERKKSGISIY